MAAQARILDKRICYIITLSSFSQVRIGCTMTHHHHHPGQAHPSPVVAPSLLRMSALERLALAAVVIALLWGAVMWAIG